MTVIRALPRWQAVLRQMGKSDGEDIVGFLGRKYFDYNAEAWASLLARAIALSKEPKQMVEYINAGQRFRQQVVEDLSKLDADSQDSSKLATLKIEFSSKQYLKKYQIPGWNYFVLAMEVDIVNYGAQQNGAATIARDLKTDANLSKPLANVTVDDMHQFITMALRDPLQLQLETQTMGGVNPALNQAYATEFLIYAALKNVMINVGFE